MTRSGVLKIAAVLIAGVVSWTPAAAQGTGGGWDVVVSPYLMGAGMSGSTTVRGVGVDVDLSASDIFSNLQFGAMGSVVARKGEWGIGGDAIWMALGNTVNNTNVDFNQGAFAFYGVRQLSPALDLTFGMRVNTLQGELTFTGPNVAQSQDKTWVDPIVGLLVRTPAVHGVQLKVYSEFGGFGAGSNVTWQVFPVVGFSLAKVASLEFGYRWLDLDYSSGTGNEAFKYDVLTQGPAFGVSFRF